MRIGLFTDSFDQINGVSKTLRKIVQFAHNSGIKLDVHTYGSGESSCERTGSVEIFRYKPILPIPYYSDMSWDAITIRREILWRSAEQNYDLIHVASPGSLRLNALLVAHSMRRPLIGTYHTAVAEIASVILSVVSGLLNWHLMRHGALLVGREGRSLGTDLRRLPRLVFGIFTVFLRRTVRRETRGS